MLFCQVVASVFEILSSKNLVLAAAKFALITKLPEKENRIKELLQLANEVNML